MTEKRSLVMKLAEVMKQVKYIEKKGFNSFHRYKYATESDVAEKVREVLAENGVMMIPNVTSQTVREHVNAKGKTEYIATVHMEFNFYDGESGEKITFNMVGEGQDAGDKAVYKAITGAQKYALMKAFMIPTGDDPEADTGTDERNSGNNAPPDVPKPANSKQIGLLKVKVMEFAKIREKTAHDVYQALNITEASLEKLSSKEASGIIQKLDGWINKAKEEQAGA